MPCAKNYGWRNPRRLKKSMRGISLRESFAEEGPQELNPEAVRVFRSGRSRERKLFIIHMKKRNVGMGLGIHPPARLTFLILEVD